MVNYFEKGIGKSFYLILLVPFVFIFFFYLNYAQNAWFFQDDFVLLRHYGNEIHWREALNFENFGRFFSRNVYWRLGGELFSPNTQLFYVLNFVVILMTAFLIFGIFNRKHGLFLSLSAALVYFVLPANIYSYSWISNSQHILGHFFVFLFLYFHQKFTQEEDSIWHVVVLLLVFLLGLASNIFMSMSMGVVVWSLLTDPRQRRKKAPYVVLVLGSALALYFFFKLTKGAVGSYSVKISMDVLLENLKFYWQSTILAVLWIFCVLIGALISTKKGHYFNAWLFFASMAFFAPFAFFVQQRYVQYGLLSHLFFFIALIAFLGNLLEERMPRLLAALVCMMVLLAAWVSISKPIRYFLESPRGAEQRQQVLFLKKYDVKHPEVKKYCFRPAGQDAAAVAAKDAPIPMEWWLVGFGHAFGNFVDATKTYELESVAEKCDARFEFDNGALVPIAQ